MEEGRSQAQGENLIRRLMAGQIGLMGKLNELLGIGEENLAFRLQADAG